METTEAICPDGSEERGRRRLVGVRTTVVGKTVVSTLENTFEVSVVVVSSEGDGVTKDSMKVNPSTTVLVNTVAAATVSESVADGTVGVSVLVVIAALLAVDEANTGLEG